MTVELVFVDSLACVELLDAATDFD